MSAARYDAVVVGAGPNGLTAAAVLSRAGRRVLVLEANNRVGGACSSADITSTGSIHDLGSAVHPLAAASPAFRALGLEQYGLTWCHPDIPVAHPLGDGTAAVAYRSLDETAAALGTDGEHYRKLIGPLVEHWDGLLASVLAPLARPPRHPLVMARFGLNGIRSAAAVGQGFASPAGAALVAGVAAHNAARLENTATAGPGLVLLAAAHVVGWPVPQGGAQAISDALARCVREAGGDIELDHPVRTLAELPPSRHVVLDITPRQLLALAGTRLPDRVARRVRRWRQAFGTYKLDYVLSAPLAWTAELCRRAGTIHVGGALHEIAASEQAVANGAMGDRPFVLVSQPTVIDQTRTRDGRHVLWAYAHVPFGSDADVTDIIERQLERYAPGFRDLIEARGVSAPPTLQEQNANLVGGDLTGGALTLRQLVWRQLTARPYRTGIEGVWMCSSSTPPGGGVHGMCGWHAAQAVLR
ncbi:MAG: NAD(P)/FAD-dependent oxidoreductase [Acidimicrobiales bacterium]